MSRSQWLACVVVALCPVSSVCAEPILYHFSGTAAVEEYTKGTNDPQLMATLGNYWFPDLQTGTFAMTGTVSYDPALFPLDADGNTRTAVPLIDWTIGATTFSMASTLGAVASPSEIQFIASVPTIVNPIPEFFIGEDSWFHLFNAAASDTTHGAFPLTLDDYAIGELFFWGRGFYLPDPSLPQDWLVVHGSIDHIEPVPEPATALLLLLGLPIAWKVRHRCQPH
jgi:hypothetical protein